MGTEGEWEITYKKRSFFCPFNLCSVLVETAWKAHVAKCTCNTGNSSLECKNKRMVLLSSYIELFSTTAPEVGEIDVASFNKRPQGFSAEIAPQWGAWGGGEFYPCLSSEQRRGEMRSTAIDSSQ